MSWYEDNKEQAKASSKKWYAKNKGRKAASNRAWRGEHKGLVLSYQSEHRAARLQRTPLWSETEAIRDVYLEAAYQQMEVDHVIPLRGRLVSGLHVWNNLQLLSEKDNKSKGNSFDIEEYNA